MRTFRRLTATLFLLTTCSGIMHGQTHQIPRICLTEAEMDLYKLINNYRREKGLDPVPLSASLTYVAQMHVRDLADNHPYNNRCNLHSWSDHGPWSPCCYTEDHRKAACMWAKPSELTNYRDPGYEIAYWTDEQLTDLEYAMKALTGWKRSYDHNVVILNQGKWKHHGWNAMGVGIYDGYAAVWFGEREDPEGSPGLCRQEANKK